MTQKRRSVVMIISWLLAVLTPLLVAGCLGQQARSHVLAPAIKAGATYAIDAANRSPTADPVKLTAFRTAVDSDDVQSVKILWPDVYAAALDGINRRTDVSEAVKPSLREPLVQLDQAIARLQ